ncbi:diphthine--ammonia ligase [Pedobacter frigiditerrae]|uniref:Diphthine--ammonia ligase n=1 Tax=Pedobacter frigiditerrae TaxID=2530452 RepID=A0A4R0MTS3_9SPHI|nr:diphthine--ammonia ligase [Pedobacter frigiditerrae]TCC90489.1 diphthine--ammonia ligase [Pedobacter frigiditerrae]
MPKQPAVFNWSGGKDSTLALHYVLQNDEFDILYLLTTINDGFNRVAMHGVRAHLLLAQVSGLKIPLIQVRLPEMPDMGIYEQELGKTLTALKSEGINHSIFGDIFLEDLKIYRENQLSKIGMKAVFPLWKRDSLELVKEFIALGYRTIVVCAQDGLQDFCGRIIDQSFLNDLPKGIDPAGENGEFHTFVFDGPIFSKEIKFSIGERLRKTFPSPNQADEEIGYWYVDLIPS